MKLTDEQRAAILSKNLRHSNDSGDFYDVERLMDDIEAELEKQAAGWHFTEAKLIEALAFFCVIDRDSVDDPEGFDDGETLKAVHHVFQALRAPSGATEGGEG
jgi:hypothetical protein